MISLERRRRRLAPVLTWAAVLLCVQGAVGTPVSGAPLFTLADRSDVILRGTVERVESHRQGALQVFTVRPERVLEGTAAVGTPIALVQELVFATERPYYVAGAPTLVFAVPLPSYSLYRAALPAGAYLRWTERKDTAAEVAALADPALVEPLADYLRVRADPPALARHLAALLAHDHPRLRADALAAIEARAELAPLLDAEALAPFAATLGDGRMPLAERGQILVRLGRRQAAGVGPLAERVLAAGAPLQAAALDVLVTIGATPAAAQLLTYSRSDDVALRLAAVRGLARVESAQALERVAEMVRGDPANEVRLAGLEALGGRADARAVELLAATLRDRDRARVNAAATALARTGSSAAITALTDVLEHGSFEAQTAAAFALKQSGKDQAVAVLRAQAETHPDPRVRKVIGLALGRTPDEHE